MNFFGFKTAAQRYAVGRPFFHPVVIEHVREFLALTRPTARVLDVGCGTGHSAVALKEIAHSIVGVDAAQEMIALAPRDARIRYAVARAESLPFGAHEFDLLTLSQVCHWLDREIFFAEARRVLRPSAWLIVYDAYFSAQMIEDESFQTWHRASYLDRYASPARDWFTFTAEDSLSAGFQLRRQEQLQHTVSFTLERLVNYLLTQSNIIAAVEEGTEETAAVQCWLTESLKPFFAEREDARFLFKLPIWYLQSA